MTLPVAGFMTSNVWPSAASTLSPPMTIRAVVGAPEPVAGACCSVVMEVLAWECLRGGSHAVGGLRR